MQCTPASRKKWNKTVVIGGGTGNATVLAGLKQIVGDGLTAIVNTFDDGGGTGKLRDEYEDLLAVGDLRQCLEAMSRAPEEQRRLFNYRFGHGKEHGEISIGGQTLGNLIIMAAGQQNGGNFSEALSLVGRMYDITGRVLPASHDNRRLQITMPDGIVIKGEHAAETTNAPTLKGSSVGFDKKPTRISPEAKAAIEDADLIVLAPGDLYTSLAPVLAVEGMREALEGKFIILISNLMNRSRHTAGFTALDYALEYERILGNEPQDEHIIKYVIYNTEMPDQAALNAQALIGSSPVDPDVNGLTKAGFYAVGRDLISRQSVVPDPNDEIAHTRSVIRHDSDKIASAIMGVFFTNNLEDAVV